MKRADKPKATNGLNKVTPEKGSSPDLTGNSCMGSQAKRDTPANKRRHALRQAQEKGEPPVVPVEAITLVTTMLGEDPMNQLLDGFVATLEAEGSSSTTMVRARVFARTVLEVATSQAGAPVTMEAIKARAVVTAVIAAVRARKSPRNMLFLVARFYTYLYTGKTQGPTVIPECEWVRMQVSCGNAPPAAVPARPSRSLSPDLDHPMAQSFIRHLERKAIPAKDAQYAIRKFLRWLVNEFHEFRGQSAVEVQVKRVQTPHLLAYLGYLKERVRSGQIAIGTARVKIQWLRRWFWYLSIQRAIFRDPMVGVPPVRGHEPVRDRYLEREQVVAFYRSVFTTSDYPLRDLALFGCYMELGLRPAEALALSIGDVDFHAPTMKVMGKGKKERIVPIPGPLVFDLDRYVQSLPRVAPELALWIGRQGQALKYLQVLKLFHRYKQAAKLVKDVGGPHVFRHILATELVKSGEDMDDIAMLLGESNLRYLQTYLHLNDAAIAEQLRRYEKKG